LRQTGVGLDFFDGGRYAVGGIVAPEVQDLQRGFECSCDRSRNSGCDQSRHVCPSTGALILFQYFCLVANFRNCNSQQNRLGCRPCHDTSSKVISVTMTANCFVGALTEAGPILFLERCKYLGHAARVACCPALWIREPITPEFGNRVSISAV